MAIATDSYTDLQVGGVTVTKIGFSKTLNNYTVADIADYVYASYSHHMIKHTIKGSNTTIYAATSDTPIPMKVTNNNGICTINAGDNSLYNNRSGLYGKIVWVSGTGKAFTPMISNFGNLKIVTEWDASHMVFELDTPQTVTIGATNYGGTKWDGSDMSAHQLWFANWGTVYWYSSNSGSTKVQCPVDIQPYMFVEIAEKPVLLLITPRLRQFKTNNNYNSSSAELAKRYDALDSSLYWDFSMAASALYDEQYGPGRVFPYTFNWGSTGQYGIQAIVEGYPDDHVMGHLVLGGSFNNLYEGFTIDWYFTSRDDIYKLYMGCGIKFKGDKLYKPIIHGGYIEGYTDNLNEPSDLDNWDGTTKHEVPDTPPTPGPTPGYDDDPWKGATFAGTGVGGAGAFAKVYYMTSTELANLRSWMNSINVPEGFDPMQQIIGLSQVPVALSGSGPENVVFVNSSAVYDPGVTTRAVDTGVSTQQAIATPISYYLGSVDIVRRMQERGEPYLDYDCQIELYLPLIGMFSLDTQAVMGRTISAYAVLDPVSGTLAAYAYVTKDGQNLPIAYGSTTIGVDLPISAQQLSVSRAALKQANAQLGASLLSGALTMLAAASSSGKSSGSGAKTSTGSSGLSAAGIREAGSDYMKASQVGNVFGDFMNWGRTIRQLSYGNNTAIAGSFGGSTAQWAYPFTPYVKIIRPRFEKPSNYNHSQGVPCVQTKTIGSCTGFIQCIGADVSGITGATDLELQAIQAALSNGIYAGGGS